MYQLETLSQEFTELVGRQVQMANALEAVRDNAHDSARKLLVFMTSNPAKRATIQTEIDAGDRLQDAAVAALAARLPAGPRSEALGALREQLLRYRQQLAANINLLAQGQVEQALTALGGETEAALSRVDSATRTLAHSEHSAAMTESSRLSEQISRGRGILMLLALLALVLGGVISRLVTRSIVRPLAQAESAARRFADGNYQHQIAITGHDEVAQLCEAVNLIAHAVGDRERRLLEMADTDLLTGLPQRARFIADGDALLKKLIESGGSAVLLCMDVDRLKTVNRLLGFDAGDALLVGTASKLSDWYQERACVGRMAGGTFVALVPLQAAEDPQGVAVQVQDVLHQKLNWQGQALDLSVSVGMALYPEHGGDSEALLRLAEQAMFESKKLRQPVTLYDPMLEVSRQLHLSLLSDLEDAIVQGQLRQFLQPKIDPVSGELLGVEALVRWQHPKRGWLPPGDFIPFAENTGRVRQVTRWMLERAVRTLAGWVDDGRALTIAVNISTLDLQDHQLVERIKGLLHENEVPSHLLRIELTETGLMAGGHESIRVLSDLSQLGVGLALDDFGTGQSSLGYLQRLPLHELKIDRSFIDGVEVDQRRLQLLGSIVQLGHGLGLKVTAEGVEREAEMEVVRRLGCNMVQGYLVGKPMDLAGFELWRVKHEAARQNSDRTES